MKKQIKKLTSIMFVISLILCFIGCKKEPEFNILDYVYTISFESNGGTEIDSQTVVLGETVEKPVDPVHNEKPETEKFAGWYKDKDLKEKYDFSTKVENSFTLYAKWRHEHSYSNEWTSDETHHWHAATCEHSSEVSEKAKHIYGPWNVVQEATKEEVGIRRRFCLTCNNEDETKIPKVKVPEMIKIFGDTITGASYTNNYTGVFIAGRTVTLSDFYMGKYEVTQEEYASVMTGQTVTVNGTEYELESNPSYCTADSTSYTLFNGDVQEKRPVEGVTWYDAVWYCNALSQKEGLTSAYNIEVTEVYKASGKTGYYIYSANVTLNENATGYRLPTEAEWEYAARGGDPNAADWNYTFSGADKADGTSYSNSKNSGLDSVGWYCYNNITGETGDSDVTYNVEGCGTHGVGKKAANALGLYDMSGNVYEWCYDWYGTVNTGTETAPTGASSGNGRVYRGGSWYDYAVSASVSYRYGDGPSGRYGDLGFRVVCPSSN